MIYYIRDEEGSLIGFKYNNTIYYYIKNIQEDIIGLTDSNHNLLCSYEYDSWGKLISIKDNNGSIITDPSHMGYINQFRYRSYYYDNETKLYYLNSRYYNPEWGRFINCDGYLGVSGDILGYNLYLYVSNNPINNSDDTGRFLKKVWNSIKKKASQVAKKVTKAVKNITKTVSSAVKKVTNKVKEIYTSLKESFVFEAEVGLGVGLNASIGSLQAGVEISQTMGYSYSANNSSTYTASSAGVDAGTKKYKIGLSFDLRHYDEGNTNPMTMPWEVWNDDSTIRDVTIGWKNSQYIGAEVNSSGGYFIGISLGAFLGVGGKIKIGFNIGG